MARALKRLWGVNKKGEKDSIVGTSLPEGWKNWDAPKPKKETKIDPKG